VTVLRLLYFWNNWVLSLNVEQRFFWNNGGDNLNIINVNSST
jgi:hypothetical protein